MSINATTYSNFDIILNPDSPISEYETLRLKNKNSIFKSVLVLMKLALGMGVMVMPYLYSKNGYLLGSFIIAAVSINMYFSSTFIIKIADDIESKSEVSSIQNFEEVSLYLTNNKTINLRFFWFVKVLLFTIF